MNQEGQRLEFTGEGPYLLPVLDKEPEGSLLQEQGVVVLQFGTVYLPMTLAACAQCVAALQELEDRAPETDPEGSVPVDFVEGALMELPLMTGASGPATQHSEVVCVPVQFDGASGRLRMSIKTAAMVGTLLSQVPVP